MDVSALIEKAGSLLIRSASDPLPICYSAQHKEIGINTRCRFPRCDSEEHRWAIANGKRTDCGHPICGSDEHMSIGLETNCTNPLCNSSDHEQVGLDRECDYICDSEEHKAAIGVGFREVYLEIPCKRAEGDNFYLGSTIANAWMYDGDTWNPIKPISTSREDHMCSLVQTDEGVSKIFQYYCLQNNY